MYPHLWKLKNSSKKRKKNLETSLISSKCHLYHIKNGRLFSQYNVLKERRYILFYIHKISELEQKLIKFEIIAFQIHDIYE